MWGRKKMSKNRHHRRSGSDDTEEKLRGRVRELEKELERERRYSRSLEKKLQPGKVDEKNDGPKERIHQQETCPQCGKGTLIERTVPNPTKHIVWAFCSLDGCNFRERRK